MSKVVEVLGEIGVPVNRLVYRGDKPQYITYFLYNEKYTLYADDEELNLRESVQVDIFSKVDYEKLVKEVKTLMKAAGYRLNSGWETYETDTGLHHRVLRYYYEEIGGE